MAAELPQVPAMLSLEGRANLIADVAGQLHQDASARREAVYAASLSHLQVVDAKGRAGVDAVVGD